MQATDKMALQPPDSPTVSIWAAALVQAGSVAKTEFLDTLSNDAAAYVAAGGGVINSSAATAAQQDADEDDGADGGGGVGKKKKHKKWTDIKSRLNKYLRARPAKEELQEKGIIKNPCFGGTITSQVAFERDAYDPESLVRAMNSAPAC